MRFELKKDQLGLRSTPEQEEEQDGYISTSSTNVSRRSNAAIPCVPWTAEMKSTHFVREILRPGVKKKSWNVSLIIG